jgi:outer membrane autotransporter protein
VALPVRSLFPDYFRKRSGPDDPAAAQPKSSKRITNRAGRTATDTRSELGARFDRLLALNPGAALSLRTRLAWAHDWISDPTLTPLFQALPGANFVVNGAAPARDSALTSVGAEVRLANGVSLLGKFDGEFAAHSSTYAGTGTVRYTWFAGHLTCLRVSYCAN